MPKALAKMGVPEADVASALQAGISLRAFSDAVAALRNVDFRARLAAIPQPVLIVNGSLDTAMVAQEHAFLAAAQQGSRHRFENCEHGVSLLRSHEFAGLLNAFVQRVAKPGALTG